MSLVLCIGLMPLPAFAAPKGGDLAAQGLDVQVEVAPDAASDAAPDLKKVTLFNDKDGQTVQAEYTDADGKNWVELYEVGAEAKDGDLKNEFGPIEVNGKSYHLRSHPTTVNTSDSSQFYKDPETGRYIAKSKMYFGDGKKPDVGEKIGIVVETGNDGGTMQKSQMVMVTVPDEGKSTVVEVGGEEAEYSATVKCVTSDGSPLPAGIEASHTVSWSSKEGATQKIIPLPATGYTVSPEDAVVSNGGEVTFTYTKKSDPVSSHIPKNVKVRLVEKTTDSSGRENVTAEVSWDADSAVKMTEMRPFILDKKDTGAELLIKSDGQTIVREDVAPAKVSMAFRYKVEKGRNKYQLKIPVLKSGENQFRLDSQGRTFANGVNMGDSAVIYLQSVVETSEGNKITDFSNPVVVEITDENVKNQKEFTEESEAKIAPVPQGQTLTYNAKEQVGVAEHAGYTLAGTAKATEVGAYTATATLKDGYTWSDGTTAPKEVNWKIDHVDMSKFTDLDKAAWYLDAKNGAFAGTETLYFDEALARGLMSGYAGTTLFGPNDPMSRAMVATVVYRMATGKTAETTDNDVDAPFPDVPRGAWYAAAVKWCAEKGIITGFTDGPNKGRFCPDDNTTREQLATITGRYCTKVAGMEPASADELKRFSDADSISGYAREGVAFCVANKVVGGYTDGTGRFDPQGNATRCQGAKIFAVTARLLDAVI